MHASERAVGILARKDAPLSKKEVVTPEDLERVPLLMAKRELVKNEIWNWFGDSYEKSK